MTTRVAALFDMDKTLIDANSGALYMRQRFARGELSGFALARGLGDYLRYKLGVLDLGAWTAALVREFAGRRRSEVAREAQRMLGAELIAHIYPEARRLVAEHQRAGHVLAIVSGAADFVVQPLATHLGIEHIVTTQLEERAGRFTGRVREPVCFEQGKIFWLRELIRAQALDLARSTFYTDSITDLPLLEMVGHPVACNPDPRLYVEARCRRWPVRLFDERAS